MMKRLRTAVAGIALLSAAMPACGRSSTADQAKPSPQTVAPASPTPQPPEPNRATAVDPARLVALIPQLPGWTRSEPWGEQILSGVAISKAEAEYVKDDSTIKLTITDSTFDPLLLAPLSMMLSPKYWERSKEDYRKYAAIGGHPGFESWQDQARDADVTVVIARRFIVNARGLNISSVDPVRALVTKIDVKTLASMK